jgi:hypothetical protein
MFCGGQTSNRILPRLILACFVVAASRNTENWQAFIRAKADAGSVALRALSSAGAAAEVGPNKTGAIGAGLRV